MLFSFVNDYNIEIASTIQPILHFSQSFNVSNNIKLTENIWTGFSTVTTWVAFVEPFKREPHKMVKHTQTIR